ncbi:hypothetical protein IU470_15875 [Nocardia abscessus]|uniref:UspA domain-containing protein n=1 Tax=Nocardia abscessus TaxID=120957 RepID=A0ABS0CD68_9NOCA|nr:hypothetical protein [Nocardia abscessus]MBF6226574.1 hypothetical protein [Nocardia abscessus]
MTATANHLHPTWARTPEPGTASPGVSTVVLVIDATDPVPVRTLPAAAARLGPGDRLVVAVLHPPTRLTLNARLVAWQNTQRARAATAALAPLLIRIDHHGLLTRGIEVHTLGCTYRRGWRPRHHRIAGALLRLCRLHHADQLVLAHSPDAGLLTDTTGHQLTQRAPADLRVHHVTTTPDRRS